MPESPSGKFGSIDIQGTPRGMVSPFRETTVLATAPMNTVIFNDVRIGRRYRVEAVCPSNACWRALQLPYCGPNGHASYFVISGGTLDGFEYGAFLAKTPNSPNWIAVKNNVYVFTATANGQILGTMAQHDGQWNQGEGSMDVVCQELGNDGSPLGELDELETFTESGTGGAIPAEGDLARQIGTSTFEIKIRRDGIVNLVDNIRLVGIFHPSANDLEITLISPSGTTVRLANRFDTSADYDGNYTFSENAPHYLRLDKVTGKLITGEARPINSLSSFIGEYVSGVWKLVITDYQQDSSGWMASWGLDITVAATDHDIYVEPPPSEDRQEIVADFRPSKYLSIFEGGGTWPTVMPPNPTIFPVNVNLVGDLVEIIYFSMWIQHNRAGDLHAVLVSPEGTKVTIFHRPGSVSGSSGNTSPFAYGEYRFYESGYSLLPNSGTISPGPYRCDPGDWPGLPNNWDIPVGSFSDFIGESVTGTWNLLIYDWNNNSNIGYIGKVWFALRFLV